jgi:hypothetical protein
MQASISHAKQDGAGTLRDARIGIYSFRRPKRQWVFPVLAVSARADARPQVAHAGKGRLPGGRPGFLGGPDCGFATALLGLRSSTGGSVGGSTSYRLRRLISTHFALSGTLPP